MAQADAFVLVREESWAAEPFYYVFGHEELGDLLRLESSWSSTT